MRMPLNEFAMRQASIYEIRNIAREMGVLSPTTQKKDELIEKILKIMKGEEKPQMPKSRQGRPPKDLESRINIVEKQNENIYQNNQKGYFNQEVDQDLDGNPIYKNVSVGSNWIIASPNFHYGESEETPDEIACDGAIEGYYLSVDKQNGYVFEKGKIINNENSIFVSDTYKNGYNLKTGDKVVCLAKIVSLTNNKYLYEIKSINGNTNPTNDREIDFEELPINYENKNCSMGLADNFAKQTGLNNIVTGTRNVILTPSLRAYKDVLLSMNNLSNNTVFVNLCLEALPEDVHCFNNLKNFENFYTLFGSSYKQNNLTVELAIERVKRLVEKGKSVCLIVNEMKKIIKYKNYQLNNNAQDIKHMSLSNCYSILSLARVLKNSSVTVVSLCKVDDNSNFEKNIISEFDNMGCYFYKLN